MTSKLDASEPESDSVLVPIPSSTIAMAATITLVAVLVLSGIVSETAVGGSLTSVIWIVNTRSVVPEVGPTARTRTE